MHVTRLSKWGNSTGLRIPKCLIDMLGLQHGDYVEMRLTDSGTILIAPRDSQTSHASAQAVHSPAAAPKPAPSGGYVTTDALLRWYAARHR